MGPNPVLRNAVLSGQRRLLRAPPQVASNISAGAAMPAERSKDEEARAKGYAEGQRQGLADAAARIADEINARQRHLAAQFDQAEAKRAADHTRRLATLDNLAHTLGQAGDTQLRAIEVSAIALAFEALCRVLGPDTGREPLLARLVQQGLAQLRGHSLLRLRMHPQDLAELPSSTEGQALVERHAAARWVADPTLERGACLLDTDHGSLDASLHTQLARLRELWSHTEALE